MGLFSSLFRSNDSDSLQRFQEETSKLINTSVKLLQANNGEGGCIKVFFEGKDSELAVVLIDSSFNQTKRHWGNDWKKFLCSSIVLGADAEAEVDTYLKSMRIIVDNPDSFESDIKFVYYYSYSLTNACKEWFTEYIRKEYPEYQLHTERKSIYFVV